MPNDRKSFSPFADVRPLIGSHQTDFSPRKQDNRDYTAVPYYNLWEYEDFVEKDKIPQAKAKSAEHINTAQTDTALSDRLSASSRETIFESEGGRSNGSRAVRGAGGQFDADHPQKFGPEDPNPDRNLRRTLSFASSRSYTDLVENDPSHFSTRLNSDADQSERALNAPIDTNPRDQAMSREQNAAIWVVVTMIIATILSTTMAVAKEMEEPMKKVDLFIFLGTMITVTLVVILVMLSRGPFEHIVGAVLVIVITGIFFAILF